MKETVFEFSGKTYPCFFNAYFSQLTQFADRANSIIITDQNIAKLHSSKLKDWKLITIPPGEENKQQLTVNHIIQQLIGFNADRQTLLIGLGGGVITDITGFVASIYMRGVKFGLIPTSILSMVDAAVGGKNGIDVGLYKNLVGVIRHPEFLFFDYSFLNTLPVAEWENGFAEIIKHACIKDKDMFQELKKNSLEYYIRDKNATALLIERNVQIKYEVVAGDEFETGERKLLNFGHTIGHAIENEYKLPHGHAVSIGMVSACKLSAEIYDFKSTTEVIELIDKYNLPTTIKIVNEIVWKILLMDKKKQGNVMNFVLLPEIGKGLTKAIPLPELQKLFEKLF